MQGLPNFSRTTLLVIFVTGCASYPTLQDVRDADRSIISKEDALKMCYFCAEKVSKSPEIGDIYRETCNDKGSNASSTLDWAKELCFVLPTYINSTE